MSTISRSSSNIAARRRATAPSGAERPSSRRRRPARPARRQVHVDDPGAGLGGARAADVRAARPPCRRWYGEPLMFDDHSAPPARSRRTARRGPRVLADRQPDASTPPTPDRSRRVARHEVPLLVEDAVVRQHAPCGSAPATSPPAQTAAALWRSAVGPVDEADDHARTPSAVWRASSSSASQVVARRTPASAPGPRAGSR